MNIFEKNNRKLINFPDRFNNSKLFLTENSRFSVGLSPGILGLRKMEICKNILNPLIPFIELIIAYDLQTAKKEFGKLQSHLTLRHGRYELDLAGQNWEYFMPLLYKPMPFSSIHEVRGSILLKCWNRGIPWENMFRHCSGPYIYDNPSAASGKAALQYAKRNLKKDIVYVIIDRLNSGLESLTMVSERSEADTIFDIAARTCHWPIAERYEMPDND